MPPLRRPTPLAEMFRWHTAALADYASQRTGKHRIPVVADDPQCGWFRRRLGKNGTPWVPGRIWIARNIDILTGELVEPERLCCEVDGERRDPYREWASLAGRPITQAQYDALYRLRREDPRMAATLVTFDLSRSPIRP